jgi:hypothetical protein
MRQRTKIYFIFSLLFVPLFQISCSKDSSGEPNNLPNADEYITWNINGNKGSLTSSSDSLASARYSSDTHLTGVSPTNQNELYLIFRGNRRTGEFPVTYSDMYINQSTYSAVPNSLQVKVTNYGGVGDYIIGSYAGNVTDATSNTLSISGNFRVKTR